MARRICVCGGGNLGHVAAAFMAGSQGYEVSILTRHPGRWGESVTISVPDSRNSITGHLACVSSHPEEVVGNADIVLLCLPGYAIHDTLLLIRDHLRPGAAVGSVVSSTGFFFFAQEVLPHTVPLFGLQRVPFIARTTEYGHAAMLLGYKQSLSVAVENTAQREELRQAVEHLFNTPTHLLASHYEVSLSNSNPLLHPSRLYDLWSDWHEGVAYPCETLFYEEWTDRAAQLYIDMDGELQQLLTLLSVTKGSIPTVLDYYESTDAPSLARKLRSITAFKGIKAPMRRVGEGYVPDFQSRYFTEDFPYGLAIVQRLAHEKGVATPTMDMILQWGLLKATTPQNGG